MIKLNLQANECQKNVKQWPGWKLYAELVEIMRKDVTINRERRCMSYFEIYHTRQ